MNALVSAPQEPLPSNRPSGPLLRTLVLCDLADSTALIERLGDQGAALLIRKHDRLARDLVQRHAGQEIDKTDGFLVLFERPIQGVAFALDYQQELQQLGKDEQLNLRARVGVHVGDVVVWENSTADVAHGAKPIEVEGLVKPVAARLANLALPGQTLVSGVAASLAQRAHGELGNKEKTSRWLNHGRYRFKGVPEPLQVYEIGEAGIAPLSAPPWSSKAHREVPWWRRPATVAIEATLLIGCVAASAWWALRPPPAIAFAERDWVVVGSLKNLTPEVRLDDAVETAFRLGLEQSHYVNVLSDLKVRETLGLMQKDPEKTRVDRAIGAEVALREGMKALILPTVAEIGGKVRITAEVIDPTTQATVYSESADGNGLNSVLPSIDKVNARLRERLGEALASVSKESQPLDKVATDNIDALRAHTLAQRAYRDGKYADSISLLEQALKLDPGFGAARVHLARALLMVDERKRAISELDLAMKDRSRLTPRDALYIEAFRLVLDESQQALEKLQLLASLYPDFLTGQSLYAYFSFQFDNRFDKDVVAAAKRADVPQNPYPTANQMLLGLLYLANERYDEATAVFASLEKQTSNHYLVTAFPYAARRQFDKAEEALARGRRSDSPAADIDRFIPAIAVAVDKGDLDRASQIVVEAKEAAAKHSPHNAFGFLAVELGLKSMLVDKQPMLKNSLSEMAKQALAAFAAADPGYRVDAQFQVLAAAYIAARLNDADLAATLLDKTQRSIADQHSPMLTKMQTIARAEVSIAKAKPGEAIEELKNHFDGTELYLSHAVLMDAYVAQGDEKSALAQATWLTTHRGRAYAESNFFLRPLNIAMSVAASKRLDSSVRSSAN